MLTESIPQHYLAILDQSKPIEMYATPSKFNDLAGVLEFKMDQGAKNEKYITVSTNSGMEQPHETNRGLFDFVRDYLLCLIDNNGDTFNRIGFHERLLKKMQEFAQKSINQSNTMIAFYKKDLAYILDV